MNYQEAMEYMERAAGYGIVPGLSNVKELLKRLGNPHQGLKVIHIAGTNGKGSTLAFLTSVLKAAGYKVGAYVSPTIFEYRERFQVQGKPVSKARTARLVEQVAVEADAMGAEGLPHPTPFEMETAMSFLLFREKRCELVVLETGMGGELDATNVIEEPLVCVFTPVSMDHMAFLGNTLEEIASQKAGIMKEGAVVVSAPQPEEVAAVLEKIAGQRGVKAFYQVEKEEIKEGQSKSLQGQKFSYGNYRNIEISLLGRYQTVNGAVVLEIVKALEGLGYPVSEKALLKGMAEAVWPGRFQILSKKPVFVVDGAHNEAGALELKKSLEFYFTNKRIIYIMGMFRDKECEKVIAHTAFLAEHIITVSTKGNPRALPALELAELAARVHPRVTASDSVEEAVELAFLLADKDTVIVAFGSLAYLGDCIRAVEVRRKK
ncbi:MAG: bifunctional folylpolyglutamate synthase/dihydrofolate synthase [Lachnospiraceae bacterium]|nr:bifunctional folylpolyglutamate synthase/dihydrofolate synthase [Lachnospiraceae bacterium]